jgi:UDP-N-acetylglucosamine 2-epimerase
MIILYYANRAEKSILDPVKVELDRRKIKNVYIDLSLCVSNIEDDKNLSRVYDYVFQQLETLPDVRSAIVIGDRREIMFACLAMFLKDIPVIQLAAGDLSGEISLVDDYFRHLITVLSKKQVCFTEKSEINSNMLLSCLNLKSDSVFLPNPTLSEIDLHKINRRRSKTKYDLVLIHPQSLSRHDTREDIRETKSILDNNKNTIVIRGNRDKNYDLLHSFWKEIEDCQNVTIHDNLKKQIFIELLAGCDRFITNSSCAFYEAPFFLSEEQIVRIGKRNKNREIAKYNRNEIKSSQKIVDNILKI